LSRNEPETIAGARNRKKSKFECERLWVLKNSGFDVSQAERDIRAGMARAGEMARPRPRAAPVTSATSG